MLLFVQYDTSCMLYDCQLQPCSGVTLHRVTCVDIGHFTRDDSQHSAVWHTLYGTSAHWALFGTPYMEHLHIGRYLAHPIRNICTLGAIWHTIYGTSAHWALFGTPYMKHLHIGRYVAHPIWNICTLGAIWQTLYGPSAHWALRGCGSLVRYFNLRHNQKVVLLSLKTNSGSLSCTLCDGGNTGFCTVM